MRVWPGGRLKVYILWCIFIIHFVVKLLHFYTKIEFYQWFQYWIKLSMTFSNAVFYGLSKSGLKFFLPTFFIWILVIFGIIGTIFSASFFLQIVKKWKQKKKRWAALLAKPLIFANFWSFVFMLWYKGANSIL